MKKFESLPAELQNEQVRPYLRALYAKRTIILKQAFDILVSAILLLLLSLIFTLFAIWLG